MTDGGGGASCPAAKYSLGVPKTIVGKPGPWGLAIGDLDGDGAADIVVGNTEDSGAGGTLNTIGVLLSKGDGTFADQVTYPYGGVPSFAPIDPIPYTIVLGDMNGDGKLDVVAGGNQTTPGVMLNNGDGTLAPPVMLGMGSTEDAASQIALADVNGDGANDVLMTDGQLEVWLNSGAGTFSGGVQYPVPDHGEGLALGDFDGDKKVDAALLGNTGSGGMVDVVLNAGSGTFSTKPATYPVASSCSDGGSCVTQGLAAADFNGDGALDLASLDVDGGVSISLNKGNGTFKPPVASQIAQQSENTPTWLVATDLNGDGKPDVVVSQDGSVSYALGKGDGTFATPIVIPLPHAEQVAAGDFTKSGIRGLAVTPGQNGGINSIYVSNASCM